MQLLRQLHVRGLLMGLALTPSALAQDVLRTTASDGSAGAATEAAPTIGPGARDVESDAAALAQAFAAALHRFRSGDDDARDSAFASARAFADATGRTDALDVVTYFDSLGGDDRRAGCALEARLDGLREDLAGDDLARRDAGVRAEAPLRALLGEATEAHDVTPAAHVASLLARLLVRRAEAHTGAAADALAREADGLAADALARLSGTGHRTPTLEPLWTRARAALVRGDADAARAHFSALARLARAVDRPTWRERGLVGLIGLARERGATFDVDAHLAELASFRSADACWALARGVAVQRLSADDPEFARAWLDAHPPSSVDAESDLDAAWAEWRALNAAAALRAGDLDRAETLVGDALDADARLMRAAIALVRERPREALAELEALDGAHRTRVDAQIVLGRALLGLGETEAGVGVLQAALDDATRRDRAERAEARGAGLWRRESATGEWLGLAAVEVLARVRAAGGDPLHAAATIEAAFAGIDADEALARLLDLAASTDIGAVTWVASADRTLAVHVTPDGRAAALEVPLGRRAILRAARRLAEATLATRTGAWTAADDALAAEIAAALLPPSLSRAIADAASGSVVFLAHGALESIPFEVLPVDGVPLGLSAALWVASELRPEDGLAPPIDGRRAQWSALGAPELGGTRFAALPGAAAELERLARVHPRFDAETGAAADRAALERAMLGSAALHVATHVVPAGTDAALDVRGIVLAGGDVMTAPEVAALAPRLPLLVLNACGSADGALLDGVGLRGIAQAALEGGTRAAVVTQWPITDDDAQVLLLAFHAALLGGADPAAALTRARSALARGGAPRADWAAARTLGIPAQRD